MWVTLCLEYIMIYTRFYITLAKTEGAIKNGQYRNTGTKKKTKRYRWDMRTPLGVISGAYKVLAVSVSNGQRVSGSC